MYNGIVNTESLVSGTYITVMLDVNMLRKNKQEIEINLCCIQFLLYSSTHILPPGLYTCSGHTAQLNKAAFKHA